VGGDLLLSFWQRYRIEIKYVVLTILVLGVLVVLVRADAFSGLNSAVDDAIDQGARFGFIGIFAIALVANLSLVIQIPYTLPVLAAAVQGDSLAHILELGIAAGIGSGIGALISYVVADMLLDRVPDLAGSRLYQWVDRNAERSPRRTWLAIFTVTATPLPDDTVIIPLAMVNYSWKKVATPMLIGKLLHNVVIAFVFYEFTQALAGSISKGVKTDLSLGLMLVFVLLTCYQAEKVRAANRSGARAADELDVDGMDGDYLVP
jgi:membrane protein YqaA with SNARE-associated domain